MSSKWEIDVDELASDLENIKEMIEVPEPNEDSEDIDDDESQYIDVRLQVYANGGWALWHGDSQYDQDHRGYWGSGTVGTDTDCTELAEDLIEQAREEYAMGNDEGEESESEVW